MDASFTLTEKLYQSVVITHSSFIFYTGANFIHCEIQFIRQLMFKTEACFLLNLFKQTSSKLSDNKMAYIYCKFSVNDTMSLHIGLLLRNSKTIFILLVLCMCLRKWGEKSLKMSTTLSLLSSICVSPNAKLTLSVSTVICLHHSVFNEV